MTDKPWPTELRLSADKKQFHIAFESGEVFELPAEYLRVESPSAEVQGHGASQKITVPGKRDVMILAVEPVGNYAVRLKFDDGHATGLYSWETLHTLGRQREEKWADYMAALANQKLSRTP
jgi:DUF971 family protein